MAKRPRSLQDLYDAIPSIDCQQKCQASCGPIGMSIDEAEAIQQAIPPYADPPATCDKETLTCPLLADDGNCMVYDVRPLICRLWGLVESMPCVYGCKAERMLTREEAQQIMQDYIRLNRYRPWVETLPGFAGGLNE